LSAPATPRVATPRYSPDGLRILVQRWRPGVGVEAVVLDRSTGATRALPLAGELAFDWLGPNRVAVGRPGSGSEFDLETGRRRAPRPLPGAAALLARASPRPVARLAGGHRLAFTAADETGSLELFLGDLDSGESRQLTRFGRSINYPFASRDGRWIGFQVAAEVGADNEIWRLGVEGGTPVRLRANAGPSWPGGFSPDGARVVYAAHRQGRWHLAIAGVDEAERLLGLPPETAGYFRWPNWSPDGVHIAYERMRHEASLWTLDLPAPP
jgi:dipeptidyl aminopeptidase/acylaminoacyl peptidase